MLKRKIEKKLIEWKKNPAHKPLIIKGARQTGKTTSIRHFASENYDSFVEINFIEHPEYKQICADGYSTQSVIRNISMIQPAFRFLPGNTLIFFDEVQDYMDITTSLKFFQEDGKYDVICSGSAPDIHYKTVSSVSVGFKEDWDMYSLDFEEFLWAIGYQENIAADLLKSIYELKAYSNLVMKRFESLFMDYIITGGMPAVVNTYVESGNFSGLLAMQKQIVKDYDDDIGKYTDGLETARVRNIYRHIASQLGKENHKFQITKLGHGARAYQYAGCEDRLKDAGIINMCFCLNDLSLPLKGNEDPHNFRMYFSDTSLLLASLDDESQNDLRIHKNLNVYFGAMYENLASEALSKQGYSLYFYRSKDARTELDFLIRHHDCIVPIEVKAGKTKARSMNAVIQDADLSGIRYGLKFGNYNIGAENHILTLPFFALFLLRRMLACENGTKLAEFINNSEIAGKE